MVFLFFGVKFGAGWGVFKSRPATVTQHPQHLPSALIGCGLINTLLHLCEKGSMCTTQSLYTFLKLEINITIYRGDTVVKVPW